MDPGDYDHNSTWPVDFYSGSSNEDIASRRSTSESISGKKEILRKVAITFYIITFILGIIGNGLVIWIAGFRMKKTISSVWFLHLAIADFLCCLSLPLIITLWDNLIERPLVYFINILCYALLIITMSASVLLLTAMSIDRWVSVMWPFWAKVHRTHKLVRITAGIIWVMSLLWTGIVIYFYEFYNAEYNTRLTINLTVLVIMFVIPFLIIFTSYVTIFLKRPQRSQRPFRIITAVILCLFICWAPYNILAQIDIFYGGYELIFHTVHPIAYIFAYINSCINPIIYVIMGQDVGHGFLRSIPFRLESAIRETVNEQDQEGHELTINSDV